jgi:hypothetical protein
MVLGGCLMTHMDDPVAKHIKAMILRTTWKASDDEGQSGTSETLNQIVRTLRRFPNYPYNPYHPHAHLGDEDPKA